MQEFRTETQKSIIEAQQTKLA